MIEGATHSAMPYHEHQFTWQAHDCKAWEGSQLVGLNIEYEAISTAPNHYHTHQCLTPCWGQDVKTQSKWLWWSHWTESA